MINCGECETEFDPEEEEWVDEDPRGGECAICEQDLCRDCLPPGEHECQSPEEAAAACLRIAETFEKLAKGPADV